MQNIEAARGRNIRALHDLARTHSDKFKVKIDSIAEGPDGAFISHLSIRNKEKGVSLLAWMPKEFTYGGGQQSYGVTPMVALKLRTRGAAYRNLLYDYLRPEDVAKVMERAVAALDYKPLDPASLPTPLTFTAPRVGITDSRNGKIVRLNSQIYCVEVMKMVTIGFDGCLTDDINAPGAECWYLLDCSGHSSATFNMVTDGEVFYPTNRITGSTKTVRIRSDGNVGKATVSLDRLSEIDKELVNAAIEDWVTRTMGA